MVTIRRTLRFIVLIPGFGMCLTAQMELSHILFLGWRKICQRLRIMTATIKRTFPFSGLRQGLGIGRTVETELSLPFNSERVKTSQRSVISTAMGKRTLPCSGLRPGLGIGYTVWTDRYTARILVLKPTFLRLPTMTVTARWMWGIPAFRRLLVCTKQFRRSVYL